MRFLLVFLGSGIGGVLRHGVGILAVRMLGAQFPFGTLAINVVGSALMGLIAGLFAALDPSAHDARLFLTTGLIGGFTTFSTFSLDVVSLWERGQPTASVAYLLASLIVSVSALMLTLTLVRRFV
ncbi:fluoride efflux transporter CrcB [Ensifer adhaerens]|uniref:fluoride efflux transporter CrcB n=1 Tax=Ensifer adhaerens TaxID=106592 RepID=UPI001CBFC0E4|nr:fluoride efflux transporter CrcB [Ensifer adhaerens]MBZ7922148.1 fluoride efflux transporter CrcB [Ensifer adhaerens]UAX94530.1 fluoride efflux transporter CrcB [Ensifer adhaerens]UAY02165.1 fluoride efflux transporter CrcB [Ensifer adhaerens]UAY09548.1 fluoride efflux transporter CrcB [Ensifer adhaerens]